MCNPTESESGQLLTINPCGWYLKLQSERDRLAGVVQGMEEQNARTVAALNKENIVMRRQMERLIDERDALRCALDLLGVPAQAKKDPDKAPPLRIGVEMAREVMEIING